MGIRNLTRDEIASLYPAPLKYGILIYMFLGHYAVAFGAKKAAPRLSLGTLFLASQFADTVWPILLLLGIEKVSIEPGNTLVTPLNFLYYPFTHSLLAALLSAALFGVVYFIFKRAKTASVVLAFAVLSHWLLDAIVHRPDLPLSFWDNTFIGLGIWNSLPLTLLLEFGLFIGGIALYCKTTKARDKAGIYGLWALTGLLLFVYTVFTFFSVSQNPGFDSAHSVNVAYGGIAAWVFIPLAYWVDSHRISNTR